MKSFGVKINHRGLAQSIVTRLQSTVSSSTTTPEIQIPLRKERGPTDLLRALEKTISRDPTAPRYKYHDDPYLIPFSNFQKRSFALAQESGRKTAMWVRQQHANLFQHRVADPVIELYLPKAVYTDKDNVSEEILKNVIRDGHKSDALTIYELLEENISDETKQELLELLCYYNNSEKISEELLSENWFKRTSENKEIWKPCPVIDKLFATLKTKDATTAARAYNAMICGYAKHSKVDKAWNLFLEAEKNKYPISLDAYNCIIGLLSYLKENVKERRALLQEIFVKMERSGIKPNVRTLNNSLKLAFAVHKHTLAMEFCRDVFMEFQAAGVKPSLASYYYALLIFYKKDDSQTLSPSSLLREIIPEIAKEKKLIIQDSMDIHFFKTAMNIAANHLEDPILADSIHSLLLKDDNYKFIGDGYKENVYYRHFFEIQVKNNSLEEFVKLYYDLLVPHIYTPEPTIMSDILNSVGVNDPEIGTLLLPKFWSDLILFNYLERRDLVAKALNLMRTHCLPPKDSPIHKMYAEAAWNVWDFVLAQKPKRIQQVNWTGPILGDVAVLSLRGGEYEHWTRTISYMFNEQNSIIGPLLPEQINELFEACLLGGHVPSAMDLINYCSDIGFEDVPAMAYKIYRNLPLADHQLSRLKKMVNPEVLKIASEQNQ